MIKMILADDEPVITRGIRKLIDWEQLGIQIIGEYEDGKSAFAAILRDQPEIALLDISMPGMSGVDIIRECHGLQSRHTSFLSVDFRNSSTRKQHWITEQRIIC